MAGSSVGWGQVARVDHRKQATVDANEDPFSPQLKQRLSDLVIEGWAVFGFSKIDDAAGIKFILVRGPSIGEGLEKNRVLDPETTLAPSPSKLQVQIGVASH